MLVYPETEKVTPFLTGGGERMGDMVFRPTYRTPPIEGEQGLKGEKFL